MEYNVQLLWWSALPVNVIISFSLLLFHVQNTFSKLSILQERKRRDFLQFFDCSAELCPEWVFKPVNYKIELNDEQCWLFNSKASIGMNFRLAPGFGAIFFSRVQVTFHLILLKLFLGVWHRQKESSCQWNRWFSLKLCILFSDGINLFAT